jgi:hypothetical protein
MADEREDKKRTDLPLLLRSGMECFRKGEFDEANTCYDRSVTGGIRIVPRLLRLPLMSSKLPVEVQAAVIPRAHLVLVGPTRRDARLHLS